MCKKSQEILMTGMRNQKVSLVQVTLTDLTWGLGIRCRKTLGRPEPCP